MIRNSTLDHYNYSDIGVPSSYKPDPQTIFMESIKNKSAKFRKTMTSLFNKNKQNNNNKDEEIDKVTKPTFDLGINNNKFTKPNADKVIASRPDIDNITASRPNIDNITASRPDIDNINASRPLKRPNIDNINSLIPIKKPNIDNSTSKPNIELLDLNFELPDLNVEPKIDISPVDAYKPIDQKYYKKPFDQEGKALGEIREVLSRSSSASSILSDLSFDDIINKNSIPHPKDLD